MSRLRSVFKHIISAEECLWCGADLSPELVKQEGRWGASVKYEQSPLHRRVCGDCFFSIGEYKPQCLVCGIKNGTGLTCRGCQSATPFQARVVASFYKDPLVRLLIQRLKYGFITELSLPLAALLAESMRSAFLNARPKYLNRTSFAAVPLHSRRRRWRGFNQAELLGRQVAAEFHMPYTTVARRVRGGPPLARLGHVERAAVIANAFRAEALEASTSRVIIVDDVWGTGSTLTEVGRVVKENAGARCIELWAAVIAA